jgi:hypothetical protein
MKCSICDEEIDHCDECGKDFKKGESIFCCTHDFDKHKCSDCYIPEEEGEVQ